ncbi:hypothetical protein TWF730_002700 [Orbilia blumenaviensis]|uniref:Amino acid transporter n=1 Tax=Orbilia blumenaviensis TaxID=1796055 RepID=A0AAV9U953_9PEZI
MTEDSISPASTSPLAGSGRKNDLSPGIENSDLVYKAYLDGATKRYRIPPEHKLGFFSVFSLIVNRMIGSGIFEQPSTVLAGCGSIGASLFVWAIGSLVAFSGLLVHIEYGLVIPRAAGHFPDTGNNSGPNSNAAPRWACFPRSGGEKNYFEFLFRKQNLLPVCVYGVIFVFLGNTAGNSITSADHLLRMAGVENPSEHERLTKGVAVAIITFACFMHTLSRRAGIYLINILAVIKLAILWAVIIASWVARGGIFEDQGSNSPPPWSNLEPSKAFYGEPGGIYGWAVSILSALFAFGGYENANYVLGEIKDPLEKFPPAAISAVSCVSVSYILTILAYYIVIPVGDMFPGADGKSPKPLLLFFAKIFDGNIGASRAASGLIALSSFGNLMTVTFIAARVKQEIAKEGIIYPYSIWRKEYNNLWQIIYNKFSSVAPPDDNQEKTPIPALVLHWVTSVILVVAPPLSIVYQLFSRMQAYMIQACFGSILGVGLLYLRYYRPWRDPDFEWISLASEAFQRWRKALPFKFLRVISWVFQPNLLYPLFYSMGTLFLVIAPWIQHGDSGESRVPQSGSLKWLDWEGVIADWVGPDDDRFIIDEDPRLPFLKTRAKRQGLGGAA